MFKKARAKAPVEILARLNDRAMPRDRGALYEDPLDDFLRTQKFGEVTGGGTQLGEDNEIVFCDVDIELRVFSKVSIEAVKSILEELGAPKGSKLIIEPTGDEQPFGVNEGLAVYLNGTDLPEEVYKTCDSNFVFQEFNRLLGSEGKIHSHWQGPTETALYMYGRSFKAMKSCLLDFLRNYPLCERARVVQIA